VVLKKQLFIFCKHLNFKLHVFFFIKKPALTQLPVSIDMHSHVLPCLDDGAPNVDTSMDLIKGLCDLGITKIIATPHIMGDLYQNSNREIRYQMIKMQLAAEVSKFPLEIHAGAEYMLDDYFCQLIMKGDHINHQG
jgi:tyrosine-protein phosphatase YwqE